LFDREELRHFGNGNWKRQVSKCGWKWSIKDTVDIDKITCVECLRLIRKDTTKGNGFKNVIDERIKELRGY